MKTILNDSKDPTFNLALEEYVLKELDTDEDIVMLWQNANSVIVGRNQNTYQEVNAQVVKDHDVKVVRRITGGGAVYHDLGNLNFSFITKSSKDNINNYKKFTDPVIKALNDMGVPAEFQGRNDIMVDGKKISGNAQAWYKDKMLHHGTILFDVDLAFVAQVLNVKQDKIQSKGIKSNRARVTNVLPYLSTQVDMKTFKTNLLEQLMGKKISSKDIISVDDRMLSWVQKRQQERFNTHKWNYGESPASSNVKEMRFPAGKLEMHFELHKGLISNFRIYGDFLDNGDISNIEKTIEGNPYESSSVISAIEKINISEKILNITKDNLIECLFQN